MWDIQDIGYLGKWMFSMWYVRNVEYLGCGTFGCKILGMWHVGDEVC